VFAQTGGGGGGGGGKRRLGREWSGLGLAPDVAPQKKRGGRHYNKIMKQPRRRRMRQEKQKEEREKGGEL